MMRAINLHFAIIPYSNVIILCYYVYIVVQIKERVIKAADYPALYDFNKQVNADINEKIVMKKQ